jgi:tetratricopeptide (TPR) repeat protein
VKLGLLGRRAVRVCVREAQATRAAAAPTAVTRVERSPRALVPDGESSWPVQAPTNQDDTRPTSIISQPPALATHEARVAHDDVARVARAMVEGSDVTALDFSRFRAIAKEALAAARALVEAGRAEALAPAIVAEIALEPQDGRALLERALQLAAGLGDTPGVLLRARALELLGDREKRRGDTEAARRAYRDAIALCAPGAPDLDRAREAALMRSVAWRNLADLELDAGDLRSAEEAARVACQAARTSESRIALARGTWTLARTALVRGELDEAELLLDRCGRIFVEAGDQRFAGRVQFERARVCEARGDFDLASALFENAFDAHLASEDLVYAARAKEALGIVAAWRSDLEGARAHLEEARVRAKALDDANAAARIEQRLHEVSLARG